MVMLETFTLGFLQKKKLQQSSNLKSLHFKNKNPNWIK